MNRHLVRALTLACLIAVLGCGAPWEPALDQPVMVGRVVKLNPGLFTNGGLMLVQQDPMGAAGDLGREVWFFVGNPTAVIHPDRTPADLASITVGTRVAVASHSDYVLESLPPQTGADTVVVY